MSYTLETLERSIAESWILAHFPPPPPKPEPLPTPVIDLGCGELTPEACGVFPLYLWLVTDPNAGYDCTREEVTVAATAEEAMAVFQPGDLHFGGGNRSALTAKRIGIALPGARPGAVLCSDVLEG